MNERYVIVLLHSSNKWHFYRYILKSFSYQKMYTNKRRDSITLMAFRRAGLSRFIMVTHFLFYDGRGLEILEPSKAPIKVISHSSYGKLII